ncbi:glycosyltransferase involved in cell wall biosynthesis [Glaciihabitans tibetensis]|uniref:Glycosyltransferase involved in cell wall biosynthesis n=1 Tax=Glaciihabitans tibetensis TaxID=1266600 RepID=A0A2T0VB93_9MICO|nr:glycosyltransferase [Glaciihabitans tibetensis]PRY67452.1 glycosyltransferase involved in cell wall biosynthesis [Glaciihabitans tibetensis]
MNRPIRVLSLYEGFFAGGARILHTDVVAGLHSGGDQQHTVLSIASAARRDSSIQYLHKDPRYVRLTEAGIDVATLGRVAGAHAPDPSAFTERQLRIAAEAVRQADVILSLKEQPLGLLLALHERGLMPNIPVAVSLHRSDPTHSGPALSWLTEASMKGLLTAEISCAQSTSDAYDPYLSPGTARYVISNGIDTDRFRPGTKSEQASTRQRLGIPAAAPVVVFAARFDAMKDPGLFLRSAVVMSQHRPETHFVMCGAGMTLENDAFRALLNESGVTSSMNLHALGIRDDMPAIYQVADVVALTSAFGEASPLCLLEGAASGATPVTTDVGDSARTVHGIGFVTSHDPADIAAAWGSALDRRQELRDLSLAARDRFGRQRMISEYAGVVSGLIGINEAAA